MRRMVAPGVWQDMGPASAHGPSTRARVEVGRPVGQMIPEASTGPTVQWSRRANDPAVKDRQRRRWNGQRVSDGEV